MSSKRREIPVFEHPIVETHCHLDYLKARPLEETLAQARAVNIERLITIAVAADNLATVRQLVTEHDIIFGTQGIHPHDADTWTAAIEREIREALVSAQKEKLVAVGEIGLDYFYENSDRDVQKHAFAAQLQIAVESNLPVVIHSRDADDDTIAILKEFETSLKRRGVIHSFTSGPGLARYAIDQGWCLGFNGISTFNKAENVRDIIRMTPLESLLLETDSPFLTPVPYRGRENAPCYIPFVAEKVAEVKEVAIEDVLSQTYKNSYRLFFSDAPAPAS